MKFFIFAPAHTTSGGPELAHQMCHEINNSGLESYMYYVEDNKKEPCDVPCPDKYNKYNTSHVTDISLVEQKDSVIIVPEGATPWLQILKNCYKVLWWMSVDNYLSATNGNNLNELKDCVDLHIVQSHYAYDYLTSSVGIDPNRVLYVSDYISESFIKPTLLNELRKDIALYNPKKGYEDIRPLIEKTTWLKWIPLINLSEEQLVLTMQLSKIYVDFGAHPGKDRIPREAAYSGCCVITNKKGSAAYFEDVPISDMYKFDNPTSQLDEIDALLHDICSNFNKHFDNFANYREHIDNEKTLFIKEVKSMVKFISNAMQ